MKTSTKAVLLSGLVFPGLGHLYLKRWVEGILLTGVAGYATYLIVATIQTIALDIVHKIESGTAPSDIDAITYLVTQQLSGSEQAMDRASMVLLACWVIGVVGAYWQGRAKDKRQGAAG